MTITICLNVNKNEYEFNLNDKGAQFPTTSSNSNEELKVELYTSDNEELSFLTELNSPAGDIQLTISANGKKYWFYDYLPNTLRASNKYFKISFGKMNEL